MGIRLSKAHRKTTTPGTHSTDFCQMSNLTTLTASTNMGFLLPLPVTFTVTLPGVLLQVLNRPTSYIPPLLFPLAQDCCTFLKHPKVKRQLRVKELFALSSGSRSLRS